MKSIRIIVATLLTGLMAVTVLTASPTRAAGSVSAPEAVAKTEARNLYGAMAISRDIATVAWNYARLKPAQKGAVSHCKKRSDYPGKCRRVGWWKNGCAALAVKPNPNPGATYPAYRFRWATTKAKAKQKARAGFGGRIILARCTKGYS